MHHCPVPRAKAVSPAYSVTPSAAKPSLPGEKAPGSTNHHHHPMRDLS